MEPQKRLQVESFKLKYRFFKDFFENKSHGEVYHLDDLKEQFSHMWSPEMLLALHKLVDHKIIISNDSNTQFRVNPIRK